PRRIYVSHSALQTCAARRHGAWVVVEEDRAARTELEGPIVAIGDPQSRYGPPPRHLPGGEERSPAHRLDQALVGAGHPQLRRRLIERSDHDLAGLRGG